VLDFYYRRGTEVRPKNLSSGESAGKADTTSDTDSDSHAAKKTVSDGSSNNQAN